MNNNKTMDRLTVTALLPQMWHRVLLALVLMMATFSDAVVGEFAYEHKAGDYQTDFRITKLSFGDNSKVLGYMEYATDLGDFRTSDAKMDKNRHFKLKKDTYLRFHANDGYVIKEIYAYNQTKGETFELRSGQSIYNDQCENYFAGKADNSFGIYLYNNKSVMPIQNIYLRSKSDMEFAAIKVTFQKENPVASLNYDGSNVLIINCLRTKNWFLGLPPDYAGKITYSTSNALVATASNGVIRGVKTGMATISAFFEAYGDYGADFTGRMKMLPTDTRQPIAATDNLLRGSDEATKTHPDNGIRTESATDDGTLYYKFAYGRSGTANASQLGFWWGAAQGAPFQSAAHKAWLAVPILAQPSPSKGFAIADGGAATGIDSPTTQPAHAPIYTLGGQRLSEPPVHRGVYIVNGKKVIMGR